MKIGELWYVFVDTFEHIVISIENKIKMAWMKFTTGNYEAHKYKEEDAMVRSELLK